jgi:hypothetical protein
MYTKRNAAQTLDNMYYSGMTPSFVVSIPNKHPNELKALDYLNKGMSLGELPIENVPYVYSTKKKKYVPYVTSKQKKNAKSKPSKPIRRPEETSPGASFF